MPDGTTNHLFVRLSPDPRTAALEALDAELAAAGHCTKEWKPRSLEGLADSVARANEHRLRCED